MRLLSSAPGHRQEDGGSERAVCSSVTQQSGSSPRSGGARGARTPPTSPALGLSWKVSGIHITQHPKSQASAFRFAFLCCDALSPHFCPILPAPHCRQ